MASRLHPLSLSLKARFALATAVLIVLIACLLTGASVLIAQRGIEDVVRARESALISQVARDLDQTIVLRKRALLQLALDLADDAAEDDRLQARLEQYRALDGLFSNLSVADAAGMVVANLQAPDARARIDLSGRPHFADTLATNAQVVSAPVRAKVDGRPLVVITAPMRGADGRITHVLFGHIDLSRDAFLKELERSRGAGSGQFHLMTADGVHIAHPQSARLLTGIDESLGDHPGLRQVLEGDHRLVRARQGEADDALVSSHRLDSTGWVVAAVYPTAEAFAFVDDVSVNASIIALVLLAVIAPLVWLVIDHQLLPLAALAARMRAGEWTPSGSYTRDEVGELTLAFDQLMAGRQRAQALVAESERNMRMVADNVPALVGYVDKRRRFVFGNQRYKAMFGIGTDELRGMRVRDVVGESVYSLIEEHVDAALRGETVCFERPMMRGGRLHWDRVQYIPDFADDGSVRGYFAMVDDISELKTYQLVLAASEKRIRTITDSMPALIGYVDRDYRYRFCNSMYEKATGMPPETLIGKTVAEVFGADSQASLAAHMQAALRGERISFELAPPARLGAHILQHDYVPDVDADGQVQGFYSMVQDITRRKATETALITQQRLLRSVTDNLPALVNAIDADGRILFANRQHEEWVGVPLARIIGQPIRSLLSDIEYESHLHFFNKAMKGEHVRWQFSKPIRGETRHFQADYIPQMEDGRAVGVTCLVNDLTETKLIEQRLSALARFDTLTGLPNRSHLVERIERAIAHSNRSGTRIALMYLDLDNFKSINDSFGHGGGDAVLVEFGRRLAASVRATDTVGRLAGDEFVILLEGLQSDQEATLVAQKIIKAMERPFDIEGVARIVTTSIGITTSTHAAAKVDGLLKHADEALYRAKQRGRNRYAATAMS